jgi:hypothetical protein
MDYLLELSDVLSGTINWFVLMNDTSDQFTVSLKNLHKAYTYFVQSYQMHYPGFPVCNGCADCNDTDLALHISAGEGFEFTSTVSDIISKSGEVIGRDYTVSGKKNHPNDIVVKIVVLKENPPPDLTEDLFTMLLFYKYLLLNKKYLTNISNDLVVQRFHADYRPGDDSVKGWFERNSGMVNNEEELFKLIFTALMVLDKRVDNPNLTYAKWADMLFVSGKRRWSEAKITTASSPFQNLRGIILNDEEWNTYLKVSESKLNGALIFDGADSEICLTAAHGNNSGALRAEKTGPLNFNNYGLKVLPSRQENQTHLIDQALEKAVETNTKIMIFPELSIGSDGLSHLIAKLNENSGGLELVVAGSYYKNDSAPYFNYAPILVKNFDNVWVEAASYSKKIPFSASPQGFKDIPDNADVVVEDIQPGTAITILPAKDVVIGVAICRDAMDLLSPHNPIHRYVDFIDLLLVISDNTGDSNMFSGVAECLARWHNCATLYTNSIAETKTGDKQLELSFCIYPFKSKSKGSTTSLSGVLTYDTSPFLLQPENDHIIKVGTVGDSIVGILASAGIKYEGVTAGERDDCCKVYKIK